MRIDRTVQADVISVDDAISDFMLSQRSRGHSPHTVAHYNVSLRHLRTFLDARGVTCLADVETKDLREFIEDLQIRFKSKTANGVASDVRALFAFHEKEENIRSNPMRRVSLPRLDKTILPAFTIEELRAIFATCKGKTAIDLRNRAILLMLLDSGIRLAELAAMRVGDVDLATGAFKVFGKGRKERICRLSPESLRVLCKYLRIRQGGVGEPLWCGERGPLTRDGLCTIIRRISEASGIHAHPHKFRRTFALMMLRNGADVYSVQQHLGHSDLTVLKRYLAQTQDDYLKCHERASPVANLAPSLRI